MAPHHENYTNTSNSNRSSLQAASGVSFCSQTYVFQLLPVRRTFPHHDSCFEFTRHQNSYSPRVSEPLHYNGSIQPFGGDTRFGFRKRIFQAVNDCVSGNSLVFTHSGVIRQFIEAFGVKEAYIGNLGFIIIEFDDFFEGAILHTIYDGMF